MSSVLRIYAVIDIRHDGWIVDVFDTAQTDEMPVALGLDGSAARHAALLLAVWLWRMAILVVIGNCRLAGNGAGGCGFYLFAAPYEKLLQPDYCRLVPVSRC